MKIKICFGLSLIHLCISPQNPLKMSFMIYSEEDYVYRLPSVKLFTTRLHVEPFLVVNSLFVFKISSVVKKVLYLIQSFTFWTRK